MGSPQNIPHLIISFIFLFLSTSTLLTIPAQGKLVEAEKKEMRMRMIRSEEIGSRPPRCEIRCNSCDHCEAIQVPVTTHKTTLSRGDDISNYKPISWKCKCGDLIFNPSKPN